MNSLEKAQRSLVKRPWPPYPDQTLRSEMRHQYDTLRATIERVIQDVIFNGVVKRYRDWICVDRLADVVAFEASENEEIQRLHKRCCGIVDAHDPSSAKDSPVPTPDDLEADIEALKKVIDTIKTRRKTGGPVGHGRST